MVTTLQHVAEGAELAICDQNSLSFTTITQKKNNVHNFLKPTGLATYDKRGHQTSIGKDITLEIRVRIMLNGNKLLLN